MGMCTKANSKMGNDVAKACISMRLARPTLVNFVKTKCMATVRMYIIAGQSISALLPWIRCMEKVHFISWTALHTKDSG